MANPCRSPTRWFLKQHARFGPNPFATSTFSINELWKSTFKRNNEWTILPSCGKTVGLLQWIWPSVCKCDIQDRGGFEVSWLFVRVQDLVELVHTGRWNILAFHRRHDDDWSPAPDAQIMRGPGCWTQPTLMENGRNNSTRTFQQCQWIQFRLARGNSRTTIIIGECFRLEGLSTLHYLPLCSSPFSNRECSLVSFTSSSSPWIVSACDLNRWVPSWGLPLGVLYYLVSRWNLKPSSLNLQFLCCCTRNSNSYVQPSFNWHYAARAEETTTYSAWFILSLVF